MAIRIEGVNLIIPLKNIDLCYPGGFAMFSEQHKNMFGETFLHDQLLFRDGVTNSVDVEPLIAFWEQKGLVPYTEIGGIKRWKDMCVIESSHAEPTFPCNWLVVDQDNDCVFFKGKPKGRIIGQEEMKLYYG